LHVDAFNGENKLPSESFLFCVKNTHFDVFYFRFERSFGTTAAIRQIHVVTTYDGYFDPNSAVPAQKQRNGDLFSEVKC